MKKIILYANGNCENHGCEALSRTVTSLFEGYEVIEYLEDPETDKKYGAEEINIRKNINENIYSDNFFVSFCYKLFYKLKLYKFRDYIRYSGFLSDINSGDICISIGGDNYCYSDITWLRSLNFWINQKGAKTVLLGVSIEPEIIKNKRVLKDLERYSLIIARESITFESLKNEGLKNCILLPDSAFMLEKKKTVLPENFVSDNTVGINISPMIMENENKSGMAYENYKKLIDYILRETDMSVCLIPHVVWSTSDDRIPLKRLYDEIGDKSRISIIEDCSCRELKYVISKCRFFVGARTHATIAAYSSCVPTLVMGYSVKAKGIAKDLFGNFDGLVTPVQELTQENRLTECFTQLYKKESEIKEGLQKIIPLWQEKAAQIGNFIETN